MIIGIPFSGRTRRELDNLIGFFVNTFPVRLEIEENLTVRRFLDNVKKTFVEALSNQDIPLTYVYKELKQKSNGLQHPLYEIVLNYEGNSQENNLKLKNIESKIIDTKVNTSKFDLNLYISEKEDNVSLELIYCTDLFTSDTITNFLQYFRNIVELIISDPSKKISQYQLEENREILNRIRRFSPPKTYNTKNLIEKFEENVLNNPNNIAIKYENEKYTYNELNVLANKFAKYLRDKGLKRGDRVGLCFDRSSQLLISLLGILKIGAAYVPLDPYAPQKRIEYICHNAEIKVAIINDEKENICDLSCINTLSWTDFFRVKNQYKPDNLDTLIDKNDLCYIIYTSGSTGKPKGVMVTHKNVYRLMEGCLDFFTFTKNDKWTMFHSFAFDFSVWEIWGALFNSSTLVIVPYHTSRSPEEFYNFLNDENITVLNQTPSAFAQLINFNKNNLYSTKLQELRYVIFGGESLSIDMLAHWTNNYGFEQPKLINMYGITETTVHVTFHEVTQKDLLRKNIIGKPLNDLEVFVFDRNLNLQPINVPGEMYISGDGVTKGYLNNDCLTEERFIKNPYNGQKMYKTGDRARYLWNGDLEYLGRIDDQIQLNGYRIELGEIESALNLINEISESAVIFNEFEKKIEAFIVLEKEITLIEIRNQLRSFLPLYMIPSRLTIVSNMPINVNGKIDKKRLVQAREIINEPENCLNEDKNELQQIVEDVWKSVLNNQSIKLDDNLFDLGGDSIQIMQIAAKMKTLGYEILPRHLYKNQTVRQLALFLESTGSNKSIADYSLVSGSMPLTPIQEWILLKKSFNINNFYQLEYLQMKEKLDLEVMVKCLELLVNHHDILRVKFKKNIIGVQQFIEVSEKRDILESFKVEKKDETIGIIKCKLDEMLKNFSISRGPIIKALHFDLWEKNEKDVLILVVNHLAIDAISWNILLEDLEFLYERVLNAQHPVLQGKTTSFKEWSNHLVNYKNSSEIDYDHLYWSEKKVDINITNRHYLYTNNGRLYQNINGVFNLQARKEESSGIIDLIICSLYMSYKKTLNKQNLLLDLEGHGREDIHNSINISRTIGWFTTIYPITLEHHTLDTKEILDYVKTERKSIPSNGFTYNLVAKDLFEGESGIGGDILLNYLGNISTGKQEYKFWILENHSDFENIEQITHPLVVKIKKAKDDLKLEWIYSNEVYSSEDISNLAQEFESVFKQVVNLEKKQFVSSFDLINQEDLSLVLEQLK